MKRAVRFLTGGIFAAILLGTLPGWAAFDKGGVLGVGARPLGMGDAFVAVADEATAVNWNPAGLIQIPRMELSGFMGPLLNGKEYYMAGGFVMPFLEQTAVGLTIVNLFHNTGSSETDANETTYKLTFATPMNVEKTVGFGVNLKFLNFSSKATAKYEDLSHQEQTIQAQAGALGMDLGFLYQLPLPQWGKKVNFGFFAEDIDTVLRWQSGSEERVPLMLQAGVAYYMEENLVITADMGFLNDPNISGQPLDRPIVDATTGRVITALEPVQYRPHLGLEGWFFNDHLGLRTGYTGFATTAGRFTGGVSYREKNFDIDYAYIGHAEHLGDSHRISGSYFFGPDTRKLRIVSLVQPPSNLRGQASNNSANLTWLPNPDPNVTGYSIFMGKAPGGPYQPIQRHIKETSVTVDGLTNGTRYYFVVKTVNNSWPAVESAPSMEASVVPAPMVPGAPTLGGAMPMEQPAQTNGVILGRDFGLPPLPVGGKVVGYNFYMSKESGRGYAKQNTDPVRDANTYVIRGLEPGRSYYLKMTSVSSDNPPVESRATAEFMKVANTENAPAK